MTVLGTAGGAHQGCHTLEVQEEERCPCEPVQESNTYEAVGWSYAVSKYPGRRQCGDTALVEKRISENGAPSRSAPCLHEPPELKDTEVAQTRPRHAPLIC